MLITTLIRKMLIQTGEPTDASGNVTNQMCLDFINEARRRLQEHVDVVKGDTRIIAESGKYDYPLPVDYKGNLYQVEYNGKQLVPANMDFLEEYDSGWRLSTTRNPPDSEPIYYVKNVPGLFFYIYPPPSEDGDFFAPSQGELGGLESLTLAGETATIQAGENGGFEDLTIAGETFNFNRGEKGGIESIVPQKNNIRTLYDKFFTDIVIADFDVATDPVTGNMLDLELEPYQDAIVDYGKGQIFLLPEKADHRLSDKHLTSFGSTLNKIMDDRIKALAPLQRSPIRKKYKSWGRRRYG
jgi:hypothetical protein